MTISHQNLLTGRADKDPEVSSYPRETCFHSTPFLPLGFQYWKLPWTRPFFRLGGPLTSIISPSQPWSLKRFFRLFSFARTQVLPPKATCPHGGHSGSGHKPQGQDTQATQGRIHWAHRRHTRSFTLTITLEPTLQLNPCSRELCLKKHSNKTTFTAQNTSSLPTRITDYSLG